MGSAGSAQFWLRTLPELLTVGLIVVQVASDGQLFRVRGADASDGSTTRASLEGKDNSDTPEDGAHGGSLALADEATASGEQSPALMSNAQQLSTPASAASSEAVRGPESAPLPESSESSASVSGRRIRLPGNRRREGRPAHLPAHPLRIQDSGTAVATTTDPSFRPRRPPCWRRLWSRVRDLASRGTEAQASTSTPFGLNRFVLLLANIVSIILSSGGIVSWPSLRILLLSRGAYASVCSNSTDSTSIEDVTSFGGESLCEQQGLLVQQLYSLGSAVSCVICVVGGVLYGRAGPRVGAVVGQILTMTGWGLLALSSLFFSAHAAATGIIGAAAPLTTFPTYCVRHLFPRHENVIIMVLGAALAASVVMPSIVVQAARSFGSRNAIWGYICIGLLPSLLIALFLIPRRDFSESETSAVRGRECGVSRPRRDRAASGRPQRRGVFQILQRIPRFLQMAFPWRTVISRAFLSLLAYRTVILFTVGYYFHSYPLMLSQGASALLESIILFSPLFCLLLGLAALVIAPIPLMTVVSTAGLLSYVAPLVPGSLSSYISTVSFSVYLGSALSQTLAILEALTTEAHYPAVAGLLVMISGLLGSLSACVYAIVTVGMFDNNPSYVQGACVVALLLQFLWLVLIRRGARMYRENEREPLAVTARPLEAPLHDEGAGSDGEDEDHYLR